MNKDTPEIDIAIPILQYIPDAPADDDIADATIVSDSHPEPKPADGAVQQAFLSDDPVIRSKQRLLNALVDAHGVVTAACKESGISKHYFNKYMDNDEKFRRLVMEVKDTAVDFAESKLFENIERRDVASILFYLETQGKARGYVKRSDKHINITLSEIEKFTDDELKIKSEELRKRIASADGTA